MNSILEMFGGMGIGPAQIFISKRYFDDRDGIEIKDYPDNGPPTRRDQLKNDLHDIAHSGDRALRNASQSEVVRALEISEELRSEDEADDRWSAESGNPIDEYCDADHDDIINHTFASIIGNARANKGRKYLTDADLPESDETVPSPWND